MTVKQIVPIVVAVLIAMAIYEIIGSRVVGAIGAKVS